MILDTSEVRPYFLNIGLKEGCEKIVIGNKHFGLHYTFMIKKGEGFYELHTTSEKENTKHDKVVLFKMTISDFEDLIKKIAELIPFYLLNFGYVTTNPGKMKRQKWILQPMDSELPTETFFEINRGGRFMRFKETVDYDKINLDIHCPDCFQYSPHSTAMVYRFKNGRLNLLGAVSKIYQNHRWRYLYLSMTKLKQLRLILTQHVYHLLEEKDFENKEQVLGFIYHLYSK